VCVFIVDVEGAKCPMHDIGLHRIRTHTENIFIYRYRQGGGLGEGVLLVHILYLQLTRIRRRKGSSSKRNNAKVVVLQRWWWCSHKERTRERAAFVVEAQYMADFFKKAFHPFGAKHTHAHKHSEHLAGNRERARESAKAAQSKYMVNGNRLEDHPAPTN